LALGEAGAPPSAHIPEYCYSYSASSLGIVMLYLAIYLPVGTAYMQYMLGLKEFTNKPVFDPSLFVTIRGS